MEQSVFNDLIQNILSLSKNTQNDNLAIERNNICNGFSLPFILNFDFKPVPPSQPLSKFHFKIDNNTGILEAFLNESLKLAILPDVKTFYPYADNAIVLVADIPNAIIKIYFPRINNYTEQIKINCKEPDEAIKGMKYINTLFKQLINASDEQRSYQNALLQERAEEQASECYTKRNDRKFDFCKLFLQEINRLCYTRDSGFIDFIANRICHEIGNIDRKTQIIDCINKALTVQDENFRYYLIGCSEKDYFKMISKLPNKPSPCTLEQVKEQIAYIDTSHQIESPKKDDEQTEVIDTEEPKKEQPTKSIDDTINLWRNRINNQSDNNEKQESQTIDDAQVINADSEDNVEDDGEDYYS